MAITFSTITSNMLVIIVTFHEVSSKYVKLPQTSESSIEPKYGDETKSTIKRQSIEYLDFSDFIAINDNEYLGEELAYIVDETKKNTQSHNRVRRKHIKIHTSYDSSHLSHLVLSSGEKLNSRSDDESCIKSIITLDIKYLRQHYTIKTESLKQNLTVVKCRENQRCGNDATQPLGYESVCTQDHTKIELIRLPVNKEIEAKNQELFSIDIPTGCTCTRRNKDDGAYF